jgi:hypothetical protein
MYQPYRFDPKTELFIHKITQTQPSEANILLHSMKKDGLTNADIYLLLALTAARHIDHHGPYIGHGTLNMAPLIQASQLLDEHHQHLALLQATVYTLDLLANPNYGPYLQVASPGIQRTTAEETLHDFQKAYADGRFQHLAENLFIGLYRQMGQDIRYPLLKMGLSEFAQNEHKLLIVQRTLDLLDISENWQYGETLLRPAIQYNASQPKTTEPWQAVQSALDRYNLRHHPLRWEGDVDPEQVNTLIERLLTCPIGNEPDLLAAEIVEGTNLPTLYEAISQASAIMLLRSSDNEEHIVTGILCILDLLRDENAPTELRISALLISLSSARTRIFKGDPHKRPLPVISSPRIFDETEYLETLITLCHNDPIGFQAAAHTSQFIQFGGNLERLAQTLMHLILNTQGPFYAIHAVKMIWGQYNQTLLSSHPNRHLHLASATSFTARALPNGLKSASRILQQL